MRPVKSKRDVHPVKETYKRDLCTAKETYTRDLQTKEMNKLQNNKAASNKMYTAKYQYTAKWTYTQQKSLFGCLLDSDVSSDS